MSEQPRGTQLLPHIPFSKGRRLAALWRMAFRALMSALCGASLLLLTSGLFLSLHATGNLTPWRYSLGMIGVTITLIPTVFLFLLITQGLNLYHTLKQTRAMQ